MLMYGLEPSMPITDRAVDRAIRANRRLQLVEQPTTLRTCLSCDQLFHSTGPDHRRCNLCKGDHRRRSIVGERVQSADPRVRGHSAAWLDGEAV